MQTSNKRRSAVKIMFKLIGLIKPLIGVMLLAIILGTLGYLCAIFLTIIASNILLNGLSSSIVTSTTGFFAKSATTLFVIMVSIAILRGLLHYAEQYCNHYIAFKLLAIIRHKVFVVLRKLAPAKLETKDKGNLVSLITTDIELLEVFYAHTISPIAIATLTSIIMVIFIAQYSTLAAFFAAVAYIVVGVIIPLINGKRGGNKGMIYRNHFGDLNSYVLDSLRGLDETIQYGEGQKKLKSIEDKSLELSAFQKDLSKLEGSQRSFTNLAILAASFGMLILMLGQYNAGLCGFDDLLICTVTMMGSFGPVVALSNLSNNLNHTLASGERVLNLLEEKPVVEEIVDETSDYDGHINFNGAEVKDLNFAYDEEEILSDYSMEIEKGKIIGIHGVSGSGKSTLLKLLMRFWDSNDGTIKISGHDIKSIPTKLLRDTESYVTQETHLFHDSIANNIRIGRPDASLDDIIDAAKKASIHDFIMSLPKGYDSEVGELGDTLSGGERQRIGIARAFLHDAPFILMDEPTSNLDSLNEGIILKSLKEASNEKTVVLVSHRRSTMNIADVVYEVKNGRIS